MPIKGVYDRSQASHVVAAGSNSRVISLPQSHAVLHYNLSIVSTPSCAHIDTTCIPAILSNLTLGIIALADKVIIYKQNRW